MTHLADTNVLIGGHRIAHGVMGQGAPVVLIHGTPSSSYIWHKVAPAIASAGYRVHVFDLLGFGLSERPWSPEVDTSVSGQVPVLKGLLAHWGLESAHIVAHDIGGATAQLFAVESPERVRSLTPIDIVSFDSWPSPRTRQQMQAGLETLIKTPDADHRAHFREWLQSAVVDQAAFAEDALDVYLEFIAGPIGQASLFQHQVAHYDAKHTMAAAERFDRLTDTPVQILWGADDAWQSVDWAYKLSDHVPGAELHVLERCGHFAMEDQPEEITRLVLDFVGRNSPAGRTA